MPSWVYFVLVQFEILNKILKQTFVTFSSNFRWTLQVYLTSLQTFFPMRIVLANNLFCLFRPCKQFFQYFVIYTFHFEYLIET